MLCLIIIEFKFKNYSVKSTTMSKPTIAAKMPAQVNLESGTYFWCACGKSSKQPFCDGSHIGSEFVPVMFKMAEKQEAWLCQCKHTKNPPYCDGTHKTL